ncbi:3'(2'),5'-bisphosphate nucleotidase CysQ [Prochlorococcus marinus]|uniref:3'(2'),5'-bisphosphate nucleotidase CysQ n=1 Tax=Prochlorococcus marinus TaxID=1219 RepID=UPI0001900551|nr:3'(2'),5'-bisphosphate nucleotidase CysQ [Prochlorococcus marinus]EEE39247.1 CysQ [Prochlorococcus marinus str. MIT 9202]
MIELPSGVDINNLIDDIRIFSWQAADILLYYSRLLENSDDKRNIIKNNNEDAPVTLADLKVNELIIKKINEKYKNINWDILSEENVKISSKIFNSKTDWIWVLDPLDGTKDFIQGTGNYAMHLALNFKQKPFIGFVLIPDKNQLWITDGKETWCEKRDGTKYRPNLTNNKKLKEMTLVTSKNHGNEILRNLIRKINFRKVKIMGSIGCKIASIIRGDSDIYICLSLPDKSSPKDWDFAAPESILKAAGGSITNLDNQELLYGETSFEHGGIIVATNDKENHGSICLEIKKIIEEYGIYPL